MSARTGTTAAPTGRIVATIELDPIACNGYGVCSELLPELITLDEWGYPILHSRDVDEATLSHAKRAAARCPKLALKVARA